MFGRIFLFLLLVPLVELALLHQLYLGTNILTTVLIVLATGVIGLNLARRQGMNAWRQIHLATASGRAPSREILDGVMVLLAGAFLITPGLLTDGVGFALLVPQVRIWLGRHLTTWFRQKTVSTFQASAWPSGTEDASPVDSGEDEVQPGVRVVPPDESRQSQASQS